MNTHREGKDETHSASASPVVAPAAKEVEELERRFKHAEDSSPPMSLPEALKHAAHYQSVAREAIALSRALLKARVAPPTPTATERALRNEVEALLGMMQNTRGGTEFELYKLRQAVAPFARLVNDSSGRIPTEKLSFADWHSLAREYNRSPGAPPDVNKRVSEARVAPAAEPVAWLRDDGLDEPVACITNRVKEIWLAAWPKNVERYTIPLGRIAVAPKARCLCVHAIEQKPGQPTVHDPRCSLYATVEQAPQGESKP